MASISPKNRGDAPSEKPAPGNGAHDPGEPLLAADSSLLRDVPVTLEARLGTVSMSVAELLALRSGAVLALATRLNEPVELYLNNALVARGEIVAVDDMFGVRIVEVAAR